MPNQDPGTIFQNEIRDFLISVGFTDVPPPQQGVTPAVFSLGGQEIDAFGRDGDFYVVIDAKTRQSLKKRGRNVRSYLSIINGYRNEVVEDIKKLYEEKHGYRDVAFIFWTKDVKIGEEHLKRAKQLKIVLRDDFDLAYYRQALGILKDKEIVRNGFLKDLALQLEELKVFPKKHDISVKTIKTKVGSKTLYTFPIDAGTLLRLAYVFRIEINSILGGSYQRLLKEKKINKIKSYLSVEGGYFPNNLIAIGDGGLTFTPGAEEGDSSYVVGSLNVPDKPCSLEILDGQHRLYGYSSLNDKKSQCLWITIIEGLSPKERAALFVTINKTQTPVPPSILWDLYQFTEPGSTRGRISKFVYKLNEEPPFKDRISLPRVRSSTAYLSFPNICEYLYSRTNLFSQHGSNDAFMGVVKAFFKAIASDDSLKADWKRSAKNKGKRGFICTNNSIAVLLRLLAKIIKVKGLPGKNEIEAWKGKLNNWVIQPFEKYLSENRTKDEDDPYKELRKLTSDKARKDASEVIWEKSRLSKVRPHDGQKKHDVRSVA